MKNNEVRKEDRKAQNWESSFDIRVQKGLLDKMLRADTRMEGIQIPGGRESILQNKEIVRAKFLLQDGLSVFSKKTRMAAKE